MKPIIFSTPMVQAILDGKKTQTRRVIKIDDAPENWKISIAGTSIVRTEPYDVKLPRYAAGDILWVRETWFRQDCTPDCAGTKDDNECPFNRVGNSCYGYKAQYTNPDTMLKWRPSIFMPKEAARLWLEVKNVRVERLQNITADDIRAEGTPDTPHDSNCLIAERQSFIDFWDSINAKRGYPWRSNPWVWVVEFRKKEV